MSECVSHALNFDNPLMDVLSECVSHALNLNNPLMDQSCLSVLAMHLISIIH